MVVITTAPLHWTKVELRLYVDLNPARYVMENCNGENLFTMVLARKDKT